MTLTYGELFAGVGGFSLGLDQIGMECAWQVEIDPYCQMALGRHWPNVPRHLDVRTVGARNLAPVDLITFGSPCQDLSVAGLRKGLDGARSGLFFEAVRIIRELRPEYALWENVPGALSSHDGRDFGAVLDALADAGAMDLCWRVLDARWFGVPQRRRRLFLVADFRGHRAAQILFERESSPRDLAKGEEARQGLAYSLSASARGTGDGHGNAWNTTYHIAPIAQTLSTQQGGQDLDSGDNQVVSRVAGSDTARYGKGVNGHFSGGEGDDNLVVGTLANTKGGPCCNQTVDAGHLIPFDTTQITSKANYSNPQPGDVCHPLAAGAHAPAIAGVIQGGSQQDQRIDPAGIAPTLAHASNTHGGHHQPMVAFDWQSGGDVRLNVSEQHTSALQASQTPAVSGRLGVRRLTPTECERLMSWPDEHTRWTPEGREIPDGRRYRMCGNGVVTSVVAWIGARLLSAHAKEVMPNATPATQNETAERR